MAIGQIQNRGHFNFSLLVKEKFSFLKDLGFQEGEVQDTLVTYRNRDTTVDIYHGRQSYEIGFEVIYRNTRFSLGEIIRAEDPAAAKGYQNFAATTREHVRQGLDQLVVLVMRYCVRALREEQEFFIGLEKHRELWSKEYALDVLEVQLRPKAAEAFEQGNFAMAVELYEQIISRLSPAELKKLEIARSRSKEHEGRK